MKEENMKTFIDKEMDFTIKFKYYENIVNNIAFEAFSISNGKKKTSGSIALDVFDAYNEQRININIKRALIYCDFSRHSFEMYLINKCFDKIRSNVKTFLKENALKRIGL